MPTLPVAQVWASLTKQQIGKYAEYFVKMRFTLHGWNVYTPDIDDRSIDFVSSPPNSNEFYAVQVKSIRGSGYAFMKKRLFSLAPSRLVVLAIFGEIEVPDLYLIPSTTWRSPDKCFVSRDFGPGRKSEPEWGVEATPKHIGSRLTEFSFQSQLDRLLAALEENGAQ